MAAIGETLSHPYSAPAPTPTTAPAKSIFDKVIDIAKSSFVERNLFYAAGGAIVAGIASGGVAIIPGAAYGLLYGNVGLLASKIFNEGSKYLQKKIPCIRVRADYSVEPRVGSSKKEKIYYIIKCKLRNIIYGGQIGAIGASICILASGGGVSEVIKGASYIATSASLMNIFDASCRQKKSPCRQNKRKRLCWSALELPFVGFIRA